MTFAELADEFAKVEALGYRVASAYVNPADFWALVKGCPYEVELLSGDPPRFLLWGSKVEAVPSVPQGSVVTKPDQTSYVIPTHNYYSRLLSEDMV